MAPTELRWSYSGNNESKHGEQRVHPGDGVYYEDETPDGVVLVVLLLVRYLLHSSSTQLGVGTSQIASGTCQQRSF